jgi:hypothetical protein
MGTLLKPGGALFASFGPTSVYFLCFRGRISYSAKMRSFDGGQISTTMAQPSSMSWLED